MNADSSSPRIGALFSLRRTSTAEGSRLKRIEVEQLRPGMYISRIEGGWFGHSFWRSQFMIEEGSDDLRELQNCGAKQVWIDTSKGLDVANGEATGEASTQAPETPNETFVDESSANAATSELEASPRSLAEELPEARALCQRAGQAMQAVLSEARLGHAVDGQRCRSLVEEVCGSVQRHPCALISLVRLKSVDEYTHLHSVAVCALMIALARTLGWPVDKQRTAGFAGLLHDIGKVGIPLDVLNKPGPLTENELTLVRQHPKFGLDLLHGSGSDMEAARDVCLHHHERPDGTGYPYGLQLEELSTLARMASICDVYDAITSDRPYKEAWDPAQALSKMAEWHGQFDQDLFHAFVRTLGVYPLGSVVQLASRRVAVVTEINQVRPLAPRVWVFFSLETRRAVPIQLLDLDGAPDRITGRWEVRHKERRLLEQLWSRPS